MALNEEIKNNIQSMKSEAKAFLDANIDYYSLLGFKVVSKATGFLLKVFAISLFIAIALLFLSFAAAFAIGKALDSNTLGFLIVGSAYLVLTIIVYALRKTIIDVPILKKFSNIFFD